MPSNPDYEDEFVDHGSPVPDAYRPPDVQTPPPDSAPTDLIGENGYPSYY